MLCSATLSDHEFNSPIHKFAAGVHWVIVHAPVHQHEDEFPEDICSASTLKACMVQFSMAPDFDHQLRDSF